MQPQEAPPAQEPAQPPAQLPPQQQQESQEQQQQQPAPAGNIGLERSMSLRKIDPLQFVKSPMPLLSADKKRAPERALGKLEDAAARDETCVWQRVSLCTLFPADSRGALRATGQDLWQIFPMMCISVSLSIP